ncbi:hypothetical protein HH216_23995 [Spirosoma rhododendri]|uniref:pPIWI-RE three-gene island domain-containing protein n=2 Tax=Spirosoma rhododendri TaxID=2728024 RepID=A0A7L5DSS5_9BACT|nr:hypothetical protein HH216_23995 [Spirosoma rhododendri]
MTAYHTPSPLLSAGFPPVVRSKASAQVSASVTHLMRWQEPLATRLRFRHSLPGRVANRLLNIELGLFLLAELLPMAPAEALPNLLNGQGIVYRERPVWTPHQHKMLSRARILLAPYQDRAVWYSALGKYATMDKSLRLFTTTGRGGQNPDASSYDRRERIQLYGWALA